MPYLGLSRLVLGEVFYCLSQISRPQHCSRGLLGTFTLVALFDSFIPGGFCSLSTRGFCQWSKINPIGWVGILGLFGAGYRVVAGEIVSCSSVPDRLSHWED
jgi:hypothetical protein